MTSKIKADWEGFRRQIENAVVEFGATVFPFETCSLDDRIGSGAAMVVYRGVCFTSKL